MQRKKSKAWMAAMLVLSMVASQLCGIFPLTAFAATEVEADGVNDPWGQVTESIKDGEVCEVTADKWLHIKSAAGNSNNPGSVLTQGPAIFANNSYTMPAEGYFEANIRSAQAGANTRFGIYLKFKDQSHNLMVGYDSGGWFWQKYGAPGSPWYTGTRVAAPSANQTVKVRLEWNATQLTKATVDGVDMFSGLPLSIDDIVSAGDKIGLKAGTYSTNLTDMYLKDIHYTGQAKVTAYSVSGKITDETNKGLSQVAVKISDTLKTVTNSQGVYTIDGILPGSYTVTAAGEGYMTGSKEIIVSNTDLSDQDITLNKAVMDAYVLSTENMDVRVDKTFPRVIDYTMKGDLVGKVFYGQTRPLDKITINGTQVVPVIASELSSDNQKVTYTMNAAGTNINAVIKAELVVDKNTLAFHIIEVKNNLDNTVYPVQTIEIPDHSLISVRSTQNGARLDGAVMATNTVYSGDSYVDVNSNMKTGKLEYMYAFLSNDELSAGIWSNSEASGRTGAGVGVDGGAANTRIMSTAVDNGTYKSMGLASNYWYYDRKVTDAQNRTFVVPTTAMPSTKVVIAGDENEDNSINWQDGAIAFRTIMNNPYKSEEVPELVAYRIAMNFGSHAQNPFLKTLDNVKKVALHTDGLGQSVLLKGYGNEGHDSGHPDYGDIGTRIGGADDMNTLMTEGRKLGARFGIHINAGEMYTEAKAFDDDLARNNYGWNWLDQGIGIDSLYDLASGRRAARFDALKAQVGDNMDFIYLDIWGNKTGGNDDSWQTRYISKQINDRGWRMSNEWGAANEYDATFQHWAADLTYGGYGAKGINSSIMRFLRNHQKDSWVGDYPGYKGAAQAPLLGGYSMKDFEGWQGRNDYDAYIRNLYTHDVSTKFIQHYKVMKWVNGDPVKFTVNDSSKGTFTVDWIPEMEIMLKDDDNNTLVITRGSNDVNDLKNYRSRTMTLNGKVVLRGAATGGDGTNPGDEMYLLPWVWDVNTGEKVAAGEERLYHWNTKGGASEWELPDSWRGLSDVVVYELTDLGKTNKKEIAVVDGKITLDAKAVTPYVVYKGEKAQLSVEWSTGMNVVDSGFNSGKLDSWSKSGDGTAAIAKSQSSNQMLKLDGAVSMTQKLRNLIPGQKYAVYVGVDNRSDAKAYMTIDAGGKELASNYTKKSIAQNYVSADAHNTSSPTEGGKSYFQSMYVFFTAPESGETAITLKREAGAGAVYFDDIRLVKTEADNIKAIDSEGKITRFEQDFEHNAQGLYPFVVGEIEGVTDNRTHLSETHDKYTKAGYRIKEVNDTIDGNWSVKINGLVNRKALAYQTIPQNFRFEPGVTYNVRFDYELGTKGAYAVTIGDGEYKGGTAILPLEEAAGTKKTYQFIVIGAESGQSWFGIYSSNVAVTSQDFTGRKDFILDNLVIEKSEVQKGDLDKAIKLADKKFQQDYTADTWAGFAAALAEAKAVMAKEDATQEEIKAAAEKLAEEMSKLKAIVASLSGVVKNGGDEAVKGAKITLTAEHAEPIEVITDGNGKYIIDELFIRNYAVKIVAEGYETIYAEEILPIAGQKNTKDFILKDKIPADYLNNFESGDISNIKDVKNSPVTVEREIVDHNGSKALKVTFVGSSDRFASIYDASAPVFTNGIVEADVTNLDAAYGRRFGILLRSSDYKTNLYVGSGDGSGQWYCEAFIDGGSNVWSSTYAGPSFGYGETVHMKVQVQGNAITLWVDGKQIFSTTLKTVPDIAGPVGFVSQRGNTYIIDNVEIYQKDTVSDNLVNATAKFTVTDSENGKPVSREITSLSGNAGKYININVNAVNKHVEAIDTVIIAVSYDKSGAMLNSTASHKVIGVGERGTLKAGILASEKVAAIKVFVLAGKEYKGLHADMKYKPVSDPVVLE